MRPILGKSSDHKHKKMMEARYEKPKMRLNKPMYTMIYLTRVEFQNKLVYLKGPIWLPFLKNLLLISQLFLSVPSPIKPPMQAQLKRKQSSTRN